MKKNTILYLLIIVLAVANVFFLAHHLGRPMERKGGTPGDFVARELQFNDEQMQRFKVLNDQHETEMRSITDDIRRLKGSLFTKISEAHVDGATVDSIASAIGGHEAMRDAKTYHHFRAIQKLCNDKQKERFNDIVKKALKKPGRERPKD